MSLSINGANLGLNAGITGTSNSGKINKNSAQYKAVARDSLSAIIQNEAMMSAEERLVYETFGGRNRIIQNKMKMYDSDGNLLNGFGVAGMCVDGIPVSQRHKIINVSEDARQKMFDETLRHFKQENGVSNGDTTRRSEIFRNYQLSVPVGDRLKGTWTLEQYEKAYRQTFYDACKNADPKWELGKDIPYGALNGITRESIDASLVKSSGQYGETLVRKTVDVTV